MILVTRNYIFNLKMINISIFIIAFIFFVNCKQDSETKPWVKLVNIPKQLSREQILNASSPVKFEIKAMGGTHVKHYGLLGDLFSEYCLYDTDLDIRIDISVFANNPEFIKWSSRKLIDEDGRFMPTPLLLYGTNIENIIQGNYSVDCRIYKKEFVWDCSVTEYGNNLVGELSLIKIKIGFIKENSNDWLNDKRNNVYWIPIQDISAPEAISYITYKSPGLISQPELANIENTPMNFCYKYCRVADIDNRNCALTHLQLHQNNHIYHFDKEVCQDGCHDVEKIWDGYFDDGEKVNPVDPLLISLGFQTSDGAWTDMDDDYLYIERTLVPTVDGPGTYVMFENLPGFFAKNEVDGYSHNASKNKQFDLTFSLNEYCQEDIDGIRFVIKQKIDDTWHKYNVDLVRDEAYMNKLWKISWRPKWDGLWNFPYINNKKGPEYNNEPIVLELGFIYNDEFISSEVGMYYMTTQIPYYEYHLNNPSIKFRESEGISKLAKSDDNDNYKSDSEVDFRKYDTIYNAFVDLYIPKEINGFSSDEYSTKVQLVLSNGTKELRSGTLTTEGYKGDIIEKPDGSKEPDYWVEELTFGGFYNDLLVYEGVWNVKANITVTSNDGTVIMNDETYPEYCKTKSSVVTFKNTPTDGYKIINIEYDYVTTAGKLEIVGDETSYNIFGARSSSGYDYLELINAGYACAEMYIFLDSQEINYQEIITSPEATDTDATFMYGKIDEQNEARKFLEYYRSNNESYVHIASVKELWGLSGGRYAEECGYMVVKNGIPIGAIIGHQKCGSKLYATKVFMHELAHVLTLDSNTDEDGILDDYAYVKDINKMHKSYHDRFCIMRPNKDGRAGTPQDDGDHSNNMYNVKENPHFCNRCITILKNKCNY